MPSHDEIARRAYELYEQRGGGDGRDWDDWLQAEREVRGAESSLHSSAGESVSRRRGRGEQRPSPAAV